MTISHKMMSHDECGKVVHRPCSKYIDSIQELNKNFIEFSLSTQIRSGIKCSLLGLTIMKRSSIDPRSKAYIVAVSRILVI